MSTFRLYEYILRHIVHYVKRVVYNVTLCVIIVLRGEIMDIKDRLRALRKALNLNQTEFAYELGVTRSAIASIETGARILTEQMLRSICLKYKVNYFWLRDGKGEMFEHVPDDMLDQLVSEYNLTDLDRKIISAYLLLPEEKRTVFREFLNTVMKD